MKAIIYNQADGKIRCIYSGPSDFLLAQIAVGENHLLGECDDSINYINNGEITPRPTQSTAIDKATLQANGVDAITITGAPTDAVFAARNLTTGEEVTGQISGSDTFTSAIVGTISLKVTKWPYLDWMATVEAV